MGKERKNVLGSENSMCQDTERSLSMGMVSDALCQPKHGVHVEDGRKQVGWAGQVLHSDNPALKNGDSNFYS